MNYRRTYVLNPYTKVDDPRSGIVTEDAARVLDGDLDALMLAALRNPPRAPDDRICKAD